MTRSAPQPGVREQEWLSAPGQAVEVVGGALVVRRIGGNPHHYVARRLAELFERQWAGCTATAPGTWALERDRDGRVLLGRVPDVLVDGVDLLRTEVFDGVPDAAVEVWSPGNTLAEMNAKRRDYRLAGLPVLVEVFLTDSRDVHVEWLTSDGSCWVSTAVAVGEQRLDIVGPRPFTVVPNELLRRAE